MGGRFSYTMAARDGSASFDFEGTYTAVEVEARIAYTMADGRTCTVTFQPEGEGTLVTEVFDAENMNRWTCSARGGRPSWTGSRRMQEAA